MPTYELKIKDEVIWAIVVAVLMPLIVALSTFDPETIADWRLWGISIGAAMVRALGGALLATLSAAKRD